MKNIVVLFIISLSFLVLLTSCEIDNNDYQIPIITSNQNLFLVKDGCLFFENVAVYDEVVKMMSKMRHDELTAFRERIKITSLFEIHQYDTNFEDENLQVKDEILAMLLNKDGVLLVGDTILKVIHHQAYLICDGDFSKIDKILNGDLSDNTIIIKSHTENFNVLKENNGIQKLRGTESQTFNVTNNPPLTMPGDPSVSREERIKLKAFCVISPFFPFGLTYIGAEMEGEARHKNGWFGTWGFWFDDEIHYGSITINSGKYGIHPNYNNNVVTGGSSFNVPMKKFKIGLEYSPTNNMRVQDLDVTYVYKKNPGSDNIVKNIVWE